MSKVHSFHGRVSPLGAERLLNALQDRFEAGEALGPRGPHIRAIAGSIEQAGQEIRRQLETIPSDLSGDSQSQEPLSNDILSLRQNLLELADAFARLGFAIQTYGE